MSWEYRVMNIDGQHAIHEVHYAGNDRARPVAYSACPTFPRGEELTDLAEDLLLYRDALSLPVLAPSDFPPTD